MNSISLLYQQTLFNNNQNNNDMATPKTAVQLSAISNIISLIPDFHFPHAYAKSTEVRAAVESNNETALFFWVQTSDEAELKRQLSRYRGRDTHAACEGCDAIDIFTPNGIGQHVICISDMDMFSMTNYFA